MQIVTLHAVESVETQGLLKLSDGTYTRDLEIKSNRGDIRVQLFTDNLESLFFEQVPKVHIYDGDLFLIYKLSKDAYAVFRPSKYCTLAKAVEDPCNIFPSETMENVWGYREYD